MKTIVRFIKGWFLFILLPIPFFRIDIAGKIAGDWNTWLIDGPKSASREFSHSVLQPMIIWVVLAIAGMAELWGWCYGDFIVSTMLTAGMLLQFCLLSFYTMTSYEAWNWAKANSFVISLWRNGIKGDTRDEAIMSFLRTQLAEASARDNWTEFNHLEHIFRRLDLWKGQRSELCK